MHTFHHRYARLRVIRLIWTPSLPWLPSLYVTPFGSVPRRYCLCFSFMSVRWSRFLFCIMLCLFIKTLTPSTCFLTLSAHRYKWPHSLKSMNSFLIHTPPPAKLYICSTCFQMLTHSFQNCYIPVQNRIMANVVHFCSNQIETYRKSQQNILEFQTQLKAYPSVLSLVSLPNRQKRTALEWFSLETWIKENRLVGKEEWQGEGEYV